MQRAVGFTTVPCGERLARGKKGQFMPSWLASAVRLRRSASLASGCMPKREDSSQFLRSVVASSGSAWLPHPGFLGAEDVLHGLRADACGLWHPLQALFHRFQYRLVFPAADAPINAGCAACFERTSRTGGRPVAVLDHPVLLAAVAPDCPLTGGASVLVAAGIVVEVALVELTPGKIV